MNNSSLFFEVEKRERNICCFLFLEKNINISYFKLSFILNCKENSEIILDRFQPKIVFQASHDLFQSKPPLSSDPTFGG